ncbi:hypothetical protein [Rhodoferax sp. TS-BS-61-7]|uniref:hypothetical protein n=1 Tax=Rhodoferax sp. TS-BS-61-7 TaxID=2094194 RepID=UPI000CF6BBBF|nr:hypothetical protein [Rhodoferax sp. TS-BS-61-7]PQA78400.1 hypothetical protein C5F53_07005 [Rhodoferax sp. TS-BS-61-7]
MDIQQVKLLAGRIRGLLEQSNIPLNHSQSLDISAAIIGLRNWPEVMAFPDRVELAELDMASAGRLAHRLKSRFSLELSAEVILDFLRPPTEYKPAHAPQIWPTGAPPGVYVTTSNSAILALLEQYEEATDGALLYAERAGNHFEGSIDLGEDGLWSSGLHRVPSGTLLVIGPIDLNQQSWESNAQRVGMACLRALDSEHRVAILVNTPAPELMYKDLQLMADSEGDDYSSGLVGVVTEDGVLEARNPFVTPLPTPVMVPSNASTDAVPSAALPLFQQALAQRKTGFLVVGSDVLEDHRAIDLVTAMLPLTEFAGPAARVLGRKRSTPAKDMLVPDAVKVLPMMSSIESAYANGYRRMLVQPGYTDAEVLLKYSNEVLFIVGAYGMDVEQVFMELERANGRSSTQAVASNLIAAFGEGHVQARSKEFSLIDMYLPPDVELSESAGFSEVYEFLREHRVLRWEDQLEKLLDAKTVTVGQVKKSLDRQRAVQEFLLSYGKKAVAQSA